ncbi:MAG: hypothetical protein HY835_05465, partial [Anaerolineae bacterium]|nr:hypothetical protein [Anaerolineae bacterium]
GGGTAVWTTAMMFFQVVLLGGYLYAHGVSRLPERWQAWVHLGLAGAAATWLLVTGWLWGTPLLATNALRPPDADMPVGYVLRVLAVSVGLPYFLLSTTSTLIQYWYGRMYPGGIPYRFYVLSNGASLAALLCYPVLFEPWLRLREQALVWTAVFVLYFVGLLVSLWRTSRPRLTVQAAARSGVGGVTGKQIAAWIMLATCASLVLQAGTNQLTQDIASVPFLWVLPLSLYLITFMLGFSDRIKLSPTGLVLFTFAGIGAAVWAQFKTGEIDILWQILAVSWMIFGVCLLCHKQVYDLRPAPQHLTLFYLMISVGGALGGVLVNILAPVIFDGFWEYYIGMAAAAFLGVAMVWVNRSAWIFRLRIPVAVVGLSGAIVLLSFPYFMRQASVTMERNFYGVIRIRQGTLSGLDTYRMVHGSTMHGIQAINQPYRSRPSAYYTESSGVGLAMQTLPNRIDLKPVRVGVIGLGVGTVAAYGLPGDVYRFYELDPAVIRFADDSPYFSYLKDSPAKIDLIPGDARLSLECEQKMGNQGYDLLIVDAFSGDSIPTHLMTLQALDVYLSQMLPEGVLAFHVSNKHLDLVPVVARLAQERGLSGVLLSGGGKEPLGNFSRWILLAQDARVLQNPSVQSAAIPLVVDERIRLWTDDYSNLLQVLH